MTTITKPISVKLDHETRTRIEHLATARRRSPHWMVREAIHQFVEREEKREAFRQDGIRAWNEYQDNGQHVTLQEADEWLAALEAGQDTEPPKCHD
ncbi:MAG: CopG family transcriptional regulator [Desulfuromonadales bacterium C00003068]|nr:MAG: CopG family transcriptional regulator [Desulfuromonadales bacterium C00003068]